VSILFTLHLLSFGFDKSVDLISMLNFFFNMKFPGQSIELIIICHNVLYSMVAFKSLTFYTIDDKKMTIFL
jgi:hypothetical protein